MTALLLALAPFVQDIPPELLDDRIPEEMLRVGDGMAPAVVRIEHGEGHGTGFVVDARGYVLTNAHVCCSPLPSVVQVTHLSDSGPQVLTYRKVLLAGFHPVHDLALLKIDPAEHGRPLTAVKLAENPPARGARVYTMGYPGDIAAGRMKILSEGRVLTLDRMAFRQRYLESDARAAPGNSGGPVVVESGEVVGVLTMKVSPDNTNLSVPTWSLRLASFVPLHQRPRDAAAAVALLREAEKCIDIARRGDIRFLELGLALYEEAAIVDVGNPDIYLKLGVAHGFFGRSRTSMAYLARALQISPWGKTPEPYTLLAGLLEKAGRKQETFAVLQEAFWKFPDGGPGLLGALAKSAYHAERRVDAAFYAHLARHAEFYRLLRKRLTEEEKGELDRREAQAVPWREHRIRDAEKARQEGRPALTPEFEAFMKGFDGVQRQGATADLTRFDGGAVKAQADAMSRKEMDVAFVRAQLKVAVSHLAKGRRELGESILREILRDYPDSAEAREAKLLLD